MRSAVEMMIRIPAVMTGEIESWPCEELMYCSRANVWQEWGFAVLCSGVAHCFSDSVQQLTQKDKVLWKGASQGSVQEQGLSTPSVTLVSLQIGFVLVNEVERKEEKRHTSKRNEEKTVLLWLWIPTRHPSHVYCQVWPAVLMLFFFYNFVSFHSFLTFSIFFLFFFVLHFCCFFLLPAESGPKYWLTEKI